MSKPVFEDLFRFSGRRNRKSYALYFLAMLMMIAVTFSVATVSALESKNESSFILGIGLLTLESLVFLIPSVAVGGQRCRDFGWTGWAYLLVIVPYVGWIFGLALLFIPGTDGPNRYGPNPIGNHLKDSL